MDDAAETPSVDPASGSKARTPGQELARDALHVTIVAGFFVLIALALKQPYVRDELFNIDHIRTRMRSLGWEGHLAFLATAILVNAAGVPRLWVCAVAGTLYGAMVGTIVGLTASLGGATLDFYFARYLLRNMILRRMPRRLQPWYELFNRHGFRATLLIRLFPLANATVTNCLGGVSRVRFQHFLAATAIGFAPLSIVFATFGSSAAKKNSLQLGLGIALFLVVMFAQWYLSRRGPEAAAEQAARD